MTNNNVIATGSEFTTIGTMPEGFRAKNQIYFPVIFGRSIGLGFTNSNGIVQILPVNDYPAGRNDIAFSISYLEN